MIQHRNHRPKILVAEPLGFSDVARALLREVGDVEERPVAPHELTAALDDCDVFWFRLGFRLTGDLLAGRRCSIIATPVTGLDRIDLDACEQIGIQVVSLKGEVAFLRGVRATAELTIGLLIALMRHIPAAAHHVLDGGWDRDEFRGSELYGKVAGVLGTGRLGSIVADYLGALGMHVLGHDPFADTPPHVEPVETIDELFARSDVLTIHVSYGDTTHHIVDERVLRASKPGLVLVNTARGGVVDAEALVTALDAGWLAGAALDVVEGEPTVGTDHPLIQYARSHDNLLIVPHIGGNTFESLAKAEDFLAQRVAEALASA